MADMIKLEKVTKTYTGAIDTQVLFDIDLSIEQGSFNSLVGQSGSGKSTMLNIIGTLDRATTGTVEIAGQNVSVMTKDQLARLRNQSIGFIFQFHHLLPEFTARENVLMPYIIQNGKTTPEIERRADELMGMVGLDQVKNNLSTEMSGGQQQRAAIARALINNPKLILADEPTGNLDTDTTDAVYRLLRQINEEYGTTFLIVTHDRKIAERTDRIIMVKDGRIELDLIN